MEIRCPEIEPALIAYLEAVFPDRVADPGEINPYQALGRAEVVRHLRAVMKTQEEEPDVSF